MSQTRPARNGRRVLATMALVELPSTAHDARNAWATTAKPGYRALPRSQCLRSLRGPRRTPVCWWWRVSARRSAAWSIAWHSAACAASGSMACRLWSAWPIRVVPDAVVYDAQADAAPLPAALAQLRQWFAGPLLVLDGTLDEVDEILALELGADGLLAHPVAPRRLRARLEALLRRHAGGSVPVMAGEAEPRFASRLASSMRCTAGCNVARSRCH